MTERTQIRSLRPGQPVPSGVPQRYRSGEGYIRLRWKFGPRLYVECYEHRVVDGRVTEAEQVHHRNHIRDDNRPENLEPLSRREHNDRHASERADEIIRRYEAGETTTAIAKSLDADSSAVYRLLIRYGVPMRPRTTLRVKPDPDFVREMHGQGVRVAAMAQRLGCARGTVTRVLDELGLPRFPEGRPSR